MKYYSKSKFDKLLFESSNHRVGTPPPMDKYKKVFFEAISSEYVLTEGIKEKLNSMIDEVMFFFKNSAANNLRISDLLAIQNKTKALGGLVSNAPALEKAINLLSKEVVGGDRLKSLVKYWFQYILQDYKEISPVVAYNKELNALRTSLEAIKDHNTLQGQSKHVDQLLGPEGLIPVLKKISEKLVYGAEELGTPEKEPSADDMLKGAIEHDRFKRHVPTKETGNISGLYNFYQERGLPKSKLHEAVLFEAVIRSLANY